MITLRKLRKLAKLSPHPIRHVFGTVKDYDNILKENPKKIELVPDYGNSFGYTAYIGFKFKGSTQTVFVGLDFIMK